MKDIQREVKREIGITLNLMGEKAVRTIVERTRDGKNRNGKRFRKYARQTVRDKRRRGVSPDPASTVTLTDTGAMMNSIQISTIDPVSGRAIITSVRSREQKKLARHVRGEGKLPIRNPIGFTREEADEIAELGQRRITAKIREIGLE